MGIDWVAGENMVVTTSIEVPVTLVFVHQHLRGVKLIRLSQSTYREFVTDEITCWWSCEKFVRAEVAFFFFFLILQVFEKFVCDVIASVVLRVREKVVLENNSCMYKSVSGSY